MGETEKRIRVEASGVNRNSIRRSNDMLHSTFYILHLHSIFFYILHSASASSTKQVHGSHHCTHTAVLRTPIHTWQNIAPCRRYEAGRRTMDVLLANCSVTLGNASRSVSVIAKQLPSNRPLCLGVPSALQSPTSCASPECPQRALNVFRC